MSEFDECIEQGKEKVGAKNLTSVMIGEITNVCKRKIGVGKEEKEEAPEEEAPKEENPEKIKASSNGDTIIRKVVAPGGFKRHLLAMVVAIGALFIFGPITWWFMGAAVILLIVGLFFPVTSIISTTFLPDTILIFIGTVVINAIMKVGWSFTQGVL
jgi:hypothetical protein